MKGIFLEELWFVLKVTSGNSTFHLKKLDSRGTGAGGSAGGADCRAAPQTRLS